MIEKIVVPVLGESITEATVAKWLKNPGDSVEADEPIVELETDKVNLEVPSPITGVLSEINSKDGSVVEVGALLGSVSDDGVSESPVVKKQEHNKNTDKKTNENNVIKLDTNKKEPRIFENRTTEKQEKDSNFYVLERNWKTVEMFLRCQTQWRVGMSGIIGFDYTSVIEMIKLYNIDNHTAMLESLQIMEASVLKAIHKEK